MPLINLLDSTTSQNDVFVFAEAVEIFKKYMPIDFINPPGQKNDKIMKTLNDHINRVHVKQIDEDSNAQYFVPPEKMLGAVYSLKDQSTPYNLVLLEKPLFNTKANSGGFGLNISGKHIDDQFTFISTNPFNDSGDDCFLYYISMHELGHMFGAGKRSFNVSKDDYGGHCTDPLCAMSHVSFEDLLAKSFIFYKKRNDPNFKPFCDDCVYDLLSINDKN